MSKSERRERNWRIITEMLRNRERPSVQKVRTAGGTGSADAISEDIAEFYIHLVETQDDPAIPAAVAEFWHEAVSTAKAELKAENDEARLVAEKRAEEATEKLELARAELESAHSTIESMSADNDSLRSSIEKLEKQLQEIKTEAVVEKTEHRAREKELQQEISRLKGVVDERDKSIADIKVELGNLSGEKQRIIELSDSRYKSMEDRLSGLLSDEKKRQEAAEKQAEKVRGEHREAITQLEDKLAELLKENHDKTLVMVALEERMSIRDQEIKEYKSRHEEQAKEVEVLRQELKVVSVNNEI